MALSGTLKTNSCNGRYYQLDWTATQSVENNTSTINWTLKLAGTDDGYWWMEHSLQLAMYGSNRIDRDTSVQRYVGSIKTGKFTVTHDDQGKGSFSAEINAALYTYAVNCTAEQTFTLNTIPRRASILTAPNFTDETENITITYSNPAGNSVTALDACISLTGDKADIAYRGISKTSGTHTFALTEEEKNILINSISSGVSRTIYFYIRTKIGSKTYYHNVSRTFTIVDAMPEVSISITDANSTTQAMTGNVNTFIRYFSKPKVTITATAKKNASIISKVVINSGVSTTVSKTSVELAELVTPEFTVTVTDSRGNTQTVKQTVNMIDYVIPTSNVEVDLPTTNGDTTVYMSGNIFFGNFGAISNSVKSLKYRYKADNGDYSEWKSIPKAPSLDGNKYSVAFPVSGLDYLKTYTFQCEIKDLLNEIFSNEVKVKTTPVFDWSENDFNFNVPVTVTDNGVSYNLLGALKAMTTEYTLDVTASTSTNYTSASGRATLVGNTLRVYFSVVRSSAPEIGNITDEQMCTLSITHNGKIKDGYNIGFINGNAGAVASFHTSDMSVDSNTLTIKLYLASTTASSTSFSGYFSIPVIINLNRY